MIEFSAGLIILIVIMIFLSSDSGSESDPDEPMITIMSRITTDRRIHRGALP